MKCSLFLPMFAASVCQSVCLSSWLHCAKMAEQIKTLFRVNAPVGPCNVVLDGGADPPTEGEGKAAPSPKMGPKG